MADDEMVQVSRASLAAAALQNLRRILDAAHTIGQRYDSDTDAFNAITAIHRTLPRDWEPLTWKYVAYFTSTWAVNLKHEFDVAAAAFPELNAFRRDAARAVFYGMHSVAHVPPLMLGVDAPEARHLVARSGALQLARAIDVEYITEAIDNELAHYCHGVPFCRRCEHGMLQCAQLRSDLLWPFVYMRMMVLAGRARYDGSSSSTLAWLMTSAPLWAFAAVLRG